jgi:hypothetical protein
MMNRRHPTKQIVTKHSGEISSQSCGTNTSKVEEGHNDDDK